MPTIEDRLPNQLGIISGNGVKRLQAEGVARRAGLTEDVLVVEGISGFDERQFQDELLAQPGIDKLKVAGYIAHFKAVEALRQGQFDPHDHPQTIFVTNDITRVVRDVSGNEVLLGKPHSVEEALQQLHMMSGNEVTEAIGSAMVHGGNIHTVEYLLSYQLHQIPESVIRRIADNPRVFDIAGSLPLQTTTHIPQGLDMIRSGQPTKVYRLAIMPEEGQPELIGEITPGQRNYTKALINPILGGGFTVGREVDMQFDNHYSARHQAWAV